MGSKQVGKERVSRKEIGEEKQLDEFMAKYEPEIAATAGKALAKMRKMVPHAIEMVYDNYNTLAIGFVPNERPSDAVFSIALYPAYVRLFFLQGKGLPDSGKRLEGTASR